MWNHPSRVSVLLCFNSANFFNQHLAIPIFKHMENMFMYTTMFFMCLKFGVARFCLKNWHRLNTTKRTHCWGHSTQLASSAVGHLRWNCSQLNGTKPQQCKVNTGSGNGFMLWGNNPLPEPILTRSISPYGVTMPHCLTYLSLVPHIYVSELGQCWFI